VSWLAGARRAWDHLWWLAAPALAGLCLYVYWSHVTPHLCYRDYWLSGDSGTAVYNAWQVTTGRTLYGDVFEYRMPLWFLLFALLFRVTGPSAQAAQILTIVTLVACAPFVALVVRRVGASRAFAIVAGALPVALFFPVWPFPIPPWLGWIPLAIGLWALGRALGADGVDRGWMARAGFLTGLYALCIQSHGAPFAVGATLGLLVALPVRRWPAVGWFVGGGLLSAAPILVYVVANGVLGEFWWNTFVWTTKYYHNELPHQLFAGVRSYYERRGLCDIGGVATNRLYDASLLAIPILPTVGALAGAAATVRALLVRLRGAALAAEDQLLVVAALGGVAAFLPEILVPAFSDAAHIGQAGLAPVVTLFLVGARARRWLRVAARGLVWVVAGVLALVYADRWQRYHPERASFDFPSFIRWYVTAAWMEDLTQPGDTIVVWPYGGWQYIAAHRESGAGETFLWADERFFPAEVWERAAREIREREPALLVFNQDDVRHRLLDADPSVARRYFWNGRAWERRDFVGDRVDGTWSFGECGDAQGTIRITQDGPALNATRASGAKPTQLLGSVRGHRVFLYGGGDSYLLTREADALRGRVRPGAGRSVACTLTKEPG
jgi:hypothetical protein